MKRVLEESIRPLVRDFWPRTPSASPLQGHPPANSEHQTRKLARAFAPYALDHKNALVDKAKN